MRLKLIIFAFLFITFSVLGQQTQLSSNAKISVLTVGAGENLNDAFGHNAFRIKDTSQGIDVVFGYGEYDFDAPNFILKFTKGKLNYLISKTKFIDFYKYYAYYNRTIKEQVLNLSFIEQQQLYNYLTTNYKPENRRYLYDFFYDNCATRIRDITQIATHNTIKFALPQHIESKTFRQLIHEHVGLNTWGSFGIDIALGSVIDRLATPTEYMFLPKYIHASFANATINTSKKLVKSDTVIFQNEEKKTGLDFLWSPLVIMSILSFIIIYITYLDYKKQRLSKWLDSVLFGTTALVGIAILLLWFATDHTATAQNYNLLWAFPLNVIVVSQLLKAQQKKWFKSYLKFLMIMLCLMTLHWLIGVQVFAIGLLPFLLALFIRYVFLIKVLDFKIT